MFGFAVHFRGGSEENTEGNNQDFLLEEIGARLLKLRACPYCTQSKASRGTEDKPGVALCAVALLGIPRLT